MKIIIIVTTNHENMALMKRGKQYLCVVHHSFVNIFANVKNPVRKEGSILLATVSKWQIWGRGKFRILKVKELEVAQLVSELELMSSDALSNGLSIAPSTSDPVQIPIALIICNSLLTVKCTFTDICSTRQLNSKTCLIIENPTMSYI